MGFSSDKSLQSNQLPISVEFPLEPDQLRNTLDISYKRIVSSVNTKEGALYTLDEQANFKKVYDINDTQNFRSGYRKVFDLVDLNGGNIGAGATVAFPHNITGLFNTIIIYASCTSVTPIYFTVVYPNVYLDAVNVNFTNPLGVALTQAMVVAEYLKN